MGQVSATLADNLRAIRTVDFSPSVAAARRNTLDMLMDGKRFGYLDPATDEQAVIDRIYVPVTGELPSRLPGTGAQAPSGQRSTTSPWPWLGWGSVGVAALGATLLGRRRATQGGR